MDNAVLSAKQDRLWSRMTRYCVRDDASPHFCSDIVVWLEIGNRVELPGLLLTGCVTRGKSLTCTRDHECQRQSTARQDALSEWWDGHQSRGHRKAPWFWCSPTGFVISSASLSLGGVVLRSHYVISSTTHILSSLSNSCILSAVSLS